MDVQVALENLPALAQAQCTLMIERHGARAIIPSESMAFIVSFAPTKNPESPDLW